ncbi:putative integrase [Mycobacterium xenopi 3993]|nr:putative integrase [Mycobacterium xenopi 3993]
MTDSGIVETTTKTNRTRHVRSPSPYGSGSRETTGQADALVFPSHRGGYLPIEEYRRAFTRAAQRLP